ncbi:MAG TPA: ABC transporter substrate-binding protein, partial [Anaerolineales bacterium]|nr:ABC transporter substrate-binding protein [Anaerolineales bacterium]
MRKFIAMISLLVALTLILTACGGAATQPPADTEPEITEPAEATEPAATEPAATEPATGEEVTLTIESWRNDDLAIWEDMIIPAFEAEYPNINVVFSPSPPAEYNGVLNTKLQGGTAGDLITCRPFDASLELFQQGHLASLNDLPGMENFSDVAKSAWITDDGSDAFCVPMASVIHGFFYNKDKFDEYGLEEPTTKEEFMNVLQTLQENGETPLAMGTAD